MKVAFRVDSGTHIGAGHLMRCRALGDRLISAGHECLFICRKHQGHLGSDLESHGHQVCHLRSGFASANRGCQDASYSEWLGATELEDANNCAAVLSEFLPDWIVVDNYSLSKIWEQEVRSYCDGIMVIDDLANREHDCDVLLDQTFGRDKQEYNRFVPGSCKLLVGATYALLRPEFHKWRAKSLNRSRELGIRHILVSMGGVDKENVTARILAALEQSDLPHPCKISVVLGREAPWVADIQRLTQSSRRDIVVREGVGNMAELMSECDLAIGAAGSTAWERCCLGLPTIMTALAQNQSRVARELAAAGAVWPMDVNLVESELPKLITEISRTSQALVSRSAASSRVTDGLGVDRVMAHLTGSDGSNGKS